MSRPRCVVLFSRSPRREGAAKGLACALFDHVRGRVVEAVRDLPGVDLLLVGDGTFPDGAPARPQRGRTFGERLRNAFADARELGYGRIVLVPGDVPGLSTAALKSAFEALETCEAVLGPSPDGGVWLIGLGADPGPLFFSARWRTARLASDLYARLGTGGHEPALLAPLPDIDRRCDLPALAADPSLDPALRSLILALLHSAAARPGPARGVTPAPVSVASCPRAPPVTIRAA